MLSLDPSAILAQLSLSPPSLIPADDVLSILELSKQLLIKEPNMLELSDPLIIVGDLHGQLYDLLEIFRIEPPPPDSTYLFLGDYVDRGYYSVEVLLYLLCLKLKFPSQVYLLRGNHESMAVTRVYGFYEECRAKYREATIYDRCLELFNCLPFAARINKRIWTVHGGLSPFLHLLDQLEAADRFQEPVQDTPMSDILWADPNGADSFTGFMASRRGAGYHFGGDVTRKFAALNRITHIARAHQLAEGGYEFYFDGLLSTIWSAPNYMYTSHNLAAVMRVSRRDSDFELRFNIFDAVPRSERTVPPNRGEVPFYFL
jgi:diadenosine tetraphosphatase ApaH/serine/threonine PP2A family protein phosphatase